jgi:GR25 family glycosyltransferase involved in LPS biosynthesis
MQGFYINLDKRTDRREHFEHISPSFNNIQRFPAIEYFPACIGCAMSHISALKKGLEIDSEYICIFEDDFMILNMDNFNNFLHDFKTIDVEWDIIVLTPRGTTIKSMSNSKFKRIINNQTATGYIIKKHFIPILINRFEEALQYLLTGSSYDIYGIDQYWKKLQLEYNFY